MGIPEDQLSDIFLPFQQLDDRHNVKEGTGLGLSISQNIAQQMGSQIQVTSTVDKGSRFWFDLDFSPAASTPESRSGSHLDLKISGYRGKQKTILVVDDLDNNREVLVNFLTPLGFQIVEANSGLDAIAKIETQQPDLILLDLVMPELDGLEVTHRLRQEASTQDLPIIIVSASTLPADESQSYQVGANAFLPKPLDLEQLLRLLEQHLQLQWTTKDGQNFSLLDPNEGVNTPENELTVMPTPAELNVLLNLAIEGEIRELLQEINHWQESKPELIPFIERVRPLAENCQLKRLKDFINNYL